MFRRKKKRDPAEEITEALLPVVDWASDSDVQLINDPNATRRVAAHEQKTERVPTDQQRTKEVLAKTKKVKAVREKETKVTNTVISKSEKHRRALKIVELIEVMVPQAEQFKKTNNPELMADLANNLASHLEESKALFNNLANFNGSAEEKKIEQTADLCLSFMVAVEEGMKAGDTPSFLKKLSERFTKLRKLILANLFDKKTGLIPMFRKMDKVLSKALVRKRAA